MPKRTLTRVRRWFRRWFGPSPEPEDAACWGCGYAMDRPEGVCMRCAWGYAPDPEWERFRGVVF
jgi:hypothetical protein